MYRLTKNHYLAMTAALENMDLADEYEATVEKNIAENVSLLTVASTIQPDKYTSISIEYNTNHDKVQLKIHKHKNMTPGFSQMLLENLAIQLDPEYYD